MRRMLFTLLLVLPLLACCIKEDRSGCPGVLMLDFRNVDPDAFGSLNVSLANVDGIFLQDYVHSDDFGKEMSYKVNKGEIFVNVHCPEQLLVPSGEQLPELFLHSSHVNFHGKELVRDEVHLRKSYCKVSIEMLSDAPTPFLLEVCGNVNGYTLTGTPSEGEFRFIPTILDNKCSVNVPRQIDSSLKLMICDSSRNELRQFSLGAYLEEAGYDWSEPDLQDVDIVIDYARAAISITVGDWNESLRFDVVI